MAPIIRISVAACVCAVFSSAAVAQEVVGTFTRGDRSGIWSARVDPAAGRLGPVEMIASEPEWRSLRKVAVRVDAEGRRVVAATAPVDDQTNFVYVDLDPIEYTPSAAPGDPRVARWAGSPRVHARSFPSELDELRAARDGFLVGGGDGFMVHAIIDPRVAAMRCPVAPPCYVTWSARSGLSPSGANPEDISVRPDGHSAWITFQKDSRDGDHRGHRLVRVGLPDMKVLGDIHLDRSLEEHHPPRSRRDHGPSPEIVRENERTNTLIVSLDNYGAVLLADLDAALEGRLAGETRLSTAIDGSFGSAYPDRIAIVDRPTGPVALVANAGSVGGAVVIDLRSRRRVATVPCRPGLEALTPLGDGSLVVAAAAGKLKERTDEGARKRHEPAPEIVVFDLNDPAATSAHVFKRPHPVVWITSAGAPDLVVAAERRTDRDHDDLTLLRIARGADGTPALEALATVEAPGRVQRVTPMPSRPPLPNQSTPGGPHTPTR